MSSLNGQLLALHFLTKILYPHDTSHISDFLKNSLFLLNCGPMRSSNRMAYHKPPTPDHRVGCTLREEKKERALMLKRLRRLNYGPHTLRGFAALLMCCLTTAGLAAVPGHGKINWADKTITVTGSGAPSLKAENVAVARLGAERAAKMDAFRNILEAVKGIRVTGTQTAGEVMAASPEVNAKVQGVVRNFKVLETKYYSDGGVDLIVQVPIDGVSQALVPTAGKNAVPVKGAPAGSDSSGTHTGIIVNAKGLKLTPALAPRIFDDAGSEVYAATFVHQEAMQKGGVVGYTKSLSMAKKDKRVGANPLVVKALKTPQKGSSDLVLAKADGVKLKHNYPVLAEAKVIIVTD